MLARWRYVCAYLNSAFWVRPALLVAGAVFLGWFAIRLDKVGVLPNWVDNVTYAGGASGARGLLSALATSSLSVAGTIFAITIAALSLASQQMGPRLLRNFTRNRGNQVALGVYLGTFAYAMVVLRSIRGPSEGDFVPHLAVTLSFILGLVCTGALVWFVHHAASSISIEVVIEVVYADLCAALAETEAAEPAPMPDMQGAAVLRSEQSGFVQQLDPKGLAEFAAESCCTIQLLCRPGQRVHRGVPIALVKPEVHRAETALRRSLVIGARRTLADDPEFAVQQLTDLAVRALSLGINDPGSASSVVDTLTSVLCELAGKPMPPGHIARGKRMLLIWPAMDYPDLLGAMFDPIRQNAAQSPSVIARILKGLTQIVQVERDTTRLTALARHADLALFAGTSDDIDPTAAHSIKASYDAFGIALAGGLPT